MYVLSSGRHKAAGCVNAAATSDVRRRRGGGDSKLYLINQPSKGHFSHRPADMKPPARGARGGQEAPLAVRL